MPRLTGYIEWSVYNSRTKAFIGNVDAVVSPEPLPASSHARVTASVQFKLGSIVDTDIMPTVHTWTEVLGEEPNNDSHSGNEDAL